MFVSDLGLSDIKGWIDYTYISRSSLKKLFKWNGYAILHMYVLLLQKISILTLPRETDI